MSKELTDRTRLSLEKALKTAKLVEARIVDTHDILEGLVGKLADINLTIFNAWVFLVMPENMADALRYIKPSDLKDSFDKCDEATIDKIKEALGLN